MGKFAIKPLTKTAGWLIAAIIVALNLKLVYESVQEWVSATDNIFVQGLIYMGGVGLVGGRSAWRRCT
jgi:manganese transport protein